MIRRLKKDVLSQLPPKKRYIVKIPIANASVRDTLRGLLEEITDKSKRLLRENAKKMSGSASSSGKEVPKNLEESLVDLQVIRKTLLMRLFNESGPAKVESILVHLDRFLADRLSGKLLIFAHHRETLDLLSNYVSRKGVEFIRIDGRTNQNMRYTLVSKFQSSPRCRIALLSIATAGIALTLTAASTVFFAELYWTPAALVQAEDRSVARLACWLATESMFLR